jgi:hypothetical protein
MEPRHKKDVIGNEGHQVLLSYFGSVDQAESAVTDLISEGLKEDDFALLLLNSNSQEATEALEPLLAPQSPGVTHLGDDTEGAADRESEIGAGIATSTPDDDVSGVEEMDDSESAAEDLMYPADDRDFADEEEAEVKLAADTGYFQTTGPDRSPRRFADSTVDAIDLPGLGALVGEGSFGETILARVFQENDTSLAWLAAQLNEREGEDNVSIGREGALLAIDVNVQGSTPQRIEEIMSGRRASWVRVL